MAGMFYSIQEAAEKLNKTEEEIKQFVQDGKLREFRDGTNLLFKVEEVEALVSEVSVPELEEAAEAEVPEPKALEAEVPEEKVTETEDQEAEALEPEIPEIEKLEVAPEEDALEMEIPEIEELEEAPQAEAKEPEIPEIPEAEEIELDIPEDEIPSAEALEEEKLAPADEAMGTSEILLSPETGAPAAPSELTDADTALTGEGISVLGESDADYEITDDTLAETAVPMGTAGTGPEMPLEEIEGDVNLDSFGSGSGLLDLSLQADDTSLGGILDEIYTDEVEGKGAALEGEIGAEPSAAIAAEAGEITTEEAPVISEPAPEVPMALARPYIEAAPDMSSNTLGMLLFLPLLVIIYTTVVAVSGQREMTPSILTGIQAFIWYIMGGASVVSLLVAGVAFMAGGNGTAKVKKPKKPKIKKAPKAPKAKKEKKPKKEKPPKKAKAPKPKKEKKKKKR